MNTSINWVQIVTAIATLLTVSVAICAIILESRRHRFSLGIELILKMEERFETKEVKERITAASGILNAAYDEADVILDFFENIGILCHRGALDYRTVWFYFFYWLNHYWYACEDYIRESRAKDHSVWQYLTKLHGQAFLIELKERNCSIADIIPSEDEIRKFLEEEKTLKA